MKEIGYAKSLMDYIFRWLAIKFLPKEEMAVADQSVGGEDGHELVPSAALMPQVDLALSRAEWRWAGLPAVRRDHGPQRLVLSLPELRKYEWVLVVTSQRPLFCCG